MPLYFYKHPKREKYIEVVQTMNEPHVYFDKNGLEWERVWTVPQASISTKIDPFNQNAFIDKLGTSKGSLGDCWDRSQEMSERRAAQTGGADPVKEEYLSNYAKKTGGKKPLAELQKQANQNFTI